MSRVLSVMAFLCVSTAPSASVIPEHLSRQVAPADSCSALEGPLLVTHAGAPVTVLQLLPLSDTWASVCTWARGELFLELLPSLQLRQILPEVDLGGIAAGPQACQAVVLQ